jgi:wyosine [tRNA(Phe)-imidazoG37] synthetase (radical SAM superfamily)
MTQKLTPFNHSRAAVGLRYVYPVFSRRSDGLSIGINLNPNNACNWRCIYCQVPDLTRGSAPDVDFNLLETELKTFLNSVLYGDFYQRFNVPKDQRIIKDIALSGNGEPTSLKAFDEVVDLIGHCASEANIFPTANFILISNGSFLHRKTVQQGLKKLNTYQGEVWFKWDSATTTGLAGINKTGSSFSSQYSKLITASQLCRTTLHTCLVNYRQQGLLVSEKKAYLNTLKKIKQQTAINSVTLYTLARESHQAEAVDLEKIPFERMENFANEIRAIGFTVSVC